MLFSLCVCVMFVIVCVPFGPQPPLQQTLEPVSSTVQIGPKQNVVVTHPPTDLRWGEYLAMNMWETNQTRAGGSSESIVLEPN